MIFLKRLLLSAVLFFCFAAFPNEQAAVRACVKNAMKAALAMDFSSGRQYYSCDYVKIAQDNKIADCKSLERVAAYFERIKDPALTFSELVKLNFMLKGQTLTEAQLANYRRLDPTERGKALVKQAQRQVKAKQEELRQIINDVLNKCRYGSLFLEKDLAVLFYKLDYMFKIKGVLVLRKENKQWKIYREFAVLDPGKKFSPAAEAEVRKFVNNSHENMCKSKKYVDLLKNSSNECVAVFADGQRMDYQQAEKRAKFFDMLQNGTPAMVQAAPLFMESQGHKVTAEMLANFSDQDKSGKGREWIMRNKDMLEKFRADMKKSYKYSIEKIFVFEDCALVLDQFYLPNNGNTKRISLAKKHQGKYLFYRSVSRKSNTAPAVK